MFNQRLIRGVLVGFGLACAPAVATAQFLGQDFATGNADGATATGVPSMAVGITAAANGDFSTAIGRNTIAGTLTTDTNAVALGDTAHGAGCFFDGAGYQQLSHGHRRTRHRSG